jgi:hypothetical protein
LGVDELKKRGMRSARARTRGQNPFSMTIREPTTLSRIFSKTGIFAGFSLYNINFAGRNSEAAMEERRAGGRLYF